MQFSFLKRKEKNKKKKKGSVWKDVGKLESLCTIVENVKWNTYCGKQYGNFIPQKYRNKIELPYQPAVLLLTILPK